MKNTPAAIGPLAMGVIFSLVFGVAPAHAENGSRTESERAEEAPFASRISLGTRGFGGVLIEGEETRPVFGGGVLVGVPIYRRIEGEASILLASRGEGAPFFVFELISKWVPEVEGSLSPHLTLGPLLSLDATNPVSLSVGGVAGGGMTVWVHDDFGIVSDLNYRLLVGSEIGHAVTLALGLVVRPF